MQDVTGVPISKDYNFGVPLLGKLPNLVKFQAQSHLRHQSFASSFFWGGNAHDRGPLRDHRREGGWDLGVHQGPQSCKKGRTGNQ